MPWFKREKLGTAPIKVTVYNRVKESIRVPIRVLYMGSSLNSGPFCRLLWFRRGKGLGFGAEGCRVLRVRVRGLRL